MLTSHSPGSKTGGNEKAAGWGCYPLQLCSRSRIAVPTAMLYLKVDTAVQREHTEHVRVTEGVEYKPVPGASQGISVFFFEQIFEDLTA